MLSAGTLGLQGAARLVAADIQYAQDTAMASGAERGVEFDPVTNRYRMFDENDVTIDLAWMRTGGHADQLDAGGDVLVPGWTVDFTTDNRFEGVDLVAANFNNTFQVRFDEIAAPIGGTANGSVMLRNADHRITVEVDGFTRRRLDPLTAPQPPHRHADASPPRTVGFSAPGVTVRGFSDLTPSGKAPRRIRRRKVPCESPAPPPAAPTPASRGGGLRASPAATLFFLSAVGLLLWGRLLLKEVLRPRPPGQPCAGGGSGGRARGAIGGSVSGRTRTFCRSHRFGWQSRSLNLTKSAWVPLHHRPRPGRSRGKRTPPRAPPHSSHASTPLPRAAACRRPIMIPFRQNSPRWALALGVLGTLTGSAFQHRAAQAADTAEPMDLFEAPAPAGESAVEMDTFGKIDLAVKDLEIAKVLQLLSIQSQKNIVTSRNVSGTSCRRPLRASPSTDALDAILSPNGFGYEEKGNFIYVYTAQELEERQQAARQLSTRARPAELPQRCRREGDRLDAALRRRQGDLQHRGRRRLRALRRLGRKKRVRPLGHHLIVRDFEENVDQIVALIDELDVRPKQVLIEATILQAALTENNAFGVDFSAFANLSSFDFFEPAGRDDDLISGGGPAETPAVPSPPASATPVPPAA